MSASTPRLVYRKAISLAESARAAGTRIRFAGQIRFDGVNFESQGLEGESPTVERVERFSAKFEVRKPQSKRYTVEWLPVLTRRETVPVGY